MISWKPCRKEVPNRGLEEFITWLQFLYWACLQCIKNPLDVPLCSAKLQTGHMPWKTQGKAGAQSMQKVSIKKLFACLLPGVVNDRKRMSFCSFCLWYQQGTAITLSVLSMSFWVCLPLLDFKTLTTEFAVARKQKTVLLQSVRKKVHLWDNVYLVHLK